MVEREGGVGKIHVLLLVIWLLILDVILLGVAGDAFNRSIDGTLTGTNVISGTVILFALVEGVFLGAAVIIGISHAFHYNSGSVGPALVTALIALGVDLLTLGFVSKEINIGGQGPREKAIDSFVIIIAFFELVYFLLLLGGLHHPKLGVGYSSAV